MEAAHLPSRSPHFVSDSRGLGSEIQLPPNADTGARHPTRRLCSVLASSLGEGGTAARAADLPAHPVDGDQAARAAPGVLDPRRVVACWQYPRDGVADPRRLTEAIRDDAADHGARFHHGATVVELDHHHGRFVLTVRVGQRHERHAGAAVILACGVWGPSLAELVGVELPLVPVAHPYVYSAADLQLRPGSFVRWPDRHVYARVHTAPTGARRLGLGSYDHTPVPVAQHQLAGNAALFWPEADFDPVMARAQRLLPGASQFRPDRQVNGVFA